MKLRVHILAAAVALSFAHVSMASAIPGGHESGTGHRDTVGNSRDSADAPTDRLGFTLRCASCPRITGPDGATYFRINTEPIVAAVRAGGPAATAGVTAGDVIVEVDDWPVSSEKAMLRLIALQSGAQPTSVRLTVKRGEGRRTITVVVGAQTAGERKSK
jgi:membrane-associated protease RseP (regulator of RpoE activity)